MIVRGQISPADFQMLFIDDNHEHHLSFNEYAVSRDWPFGLFGQSVNDSSEILKWGVKFGNKRIHPSPDINLYEKIR